MGYHHHTHHPGSYSNHRYHLRNQGRLSHTPREYGVDRNLEKAFERVAKDIERNMKHAHKKTKTHHKKKHQKCETTEAVHGEVVRRWDKIKLYTGPTRKHSAFKGCWKNDDIYEYFATNSTGTQGVQVFSFNTPRQCTVSDGVGYDPKTQAVKSPFDTNPFQTNTGGVYYPSTIAPTDDRVKIRKMKVKFQFANFTAPLPMELDIYVLGCKKNCPNDPLTEWNNNLSSQALGQVAAAEPVGAGAGTIGYPQANFPDERPDFLPAWKKYFKILKKKRFTLATNANAVQTFDFDYGGKILDKKYLDELRSDGMQGAAGVSIFVMFIWRMGLIIDKSSGNHANIGSGELAWVVNKEIVFEQCNANRLQAEMMFANIKYNTALANEVDMNVIDVVQNVTNVV